MKNVESKLHQKLNTFADWVIRITLINILMVICSLPILTIYPAFVAGYKLFNDYANKNEKPIIKTFFKYFIEDFSIKMQLGLMLALAIGVAIFNLTIYADIAALDPSPINTIGTYVMIIMVATVVFVLIYTLPLMITYPKTNLWLMMKFAFFLSGKYIFRTVLAVLIALIPVALMLTPITMLLFIFVGLSTPVVLYALLFKPVVKFIEELDRENA
ncbi:DUF624 domain-containing protein [Acholeplasma hippikon]|uniref:Predicted integral membrane protein n=1 Tax=Acholeplasma hippikon TaxID=264636 RepID=A0A449BK08_9MOLU|nr:DUF624 domain-containing protein [Acholeplasma hippikon]VEU82805.1 Predicted integral membrane protein [Acholeplasma hippikon]